MEDDSADSSPRACTSNCSQIGARAPEIEMGGIGGRGPSMETATQQVNLGITIRWEWRRMEELLSRKAKLELVIWIRGNQESPVAS
jgi:hypothetical protein